MKHVEEGLPAAPPAGPPGIPPARPLVVLSPHLDDAVISVGGLIAREAAGGRPVRVVSFFAAYPPRLEEVPARYRRLLAYDRRRSEDRGALASIGAESVWLDFCERAVLRPAIPHGLGVFSLPRPAVLTQFRNLSPLKEHIAQLVSSAPRPLIVAPLAIGGHVDHVELFLATALVMLETESFDDFRFYEDVYAMSARCRRRHFLAARYRWPRTKAPCLAGWVAAAMLTGMGWAGRGPRVDEYLPSLRTGLSWRCDRLPLAGFEAAKLEAMRLYPSQMEVFGGCRRFCALVRRWHSAWGDAELLWTAQPCEQPDRATKPLRRPAPADNSRASGRRSDPS